MKSVYRRKIGNHLSLRTYFFRPTCTKQATQTYPLKRCIYTYACKDCSLLFSWTLAGHAGASSQSFDINRVLMMSSASATNLSQSSLHVGTSLMRPMDCPHDQTEVSASPVSWNETR